MYTLYILINIVHIFSHANKYEAIKDIFFRLTWTFNARAPGTLPSFCVLTGLARINKVDSGGPGSVRGKKSMVK